MPNWTDDNGYNHFQDGLESSLGKRWQKYLQSKNVDPVLVNKVLTKQLELSNLYKQQTDLENKIAALRREITTLQMPAAHY